MVYDQLHVQYPILISVDRMGCCGGSYLDLLNSLTPKPKVVPEGVGIAYLIRNRTFFFFRACNQPSD